MDTKISTNITQEVEQVVNRAYEDYEDAMEYLEDLQEDEPEACQTTIEEAMVDIFEAAKQLLTVHSTIQL